MFLLYSCVTSPYQHSTEPPLGKLIILWTRQLVRGVLLIFLCLSDPHMFQCCICDFLLCVCVYLCESVLTKYECCRSVYFVSTAAPGQKSFIPWPGLNKMPKLVNATGHCIGKVCVLFRTSSLFNK